MLNTEFDELRSWMFGSLNELLSDIQTNPDFEIIKMPIGEPTLNPPKFINESLKNSLSDW